VLTFLSAAKSGWAKGQYRPDWGAADGCATIMPVGALLCLAGLFFQPREVAAQAMPSPEIQRRIDSVCAFLTPPVVEKDDARQTLWERMAADHVPGVSVAVIHNGEIEWAQGFGVVQPGGAPVTVDTLFQAGSISKPVAAMAALRLVREGKLSLDSDVNQALTSWKIPASGAAPEGVVTLRELLAHSAGWLSARGVQLPSTWKAFELERSALGKF
jgi:CubicO group peptidase (beta-lactamase class C family)